MHGDPRRPPGSELDQGDRIRLHGDQRLAGSVKDQGVAQECCG
jgi:hypothetical protein